MTRERRYLVTGAFGAIGVWTLRSLLERGHRAVTFDIGGSGHRLPLALAREQLDAVVQVRGDITDLETLERVLDEHEITNVIHLAALQVPFVRADPVLGARVNVVGTVNVLEAVRRRADRIGPVLYASSIAAYGDPPSTLYGVFKQANESTAVRYFEDFGVSSIGLRPHSVYGPARDQGVTSAPTTAMLAAVAKVPFRIPYGGGATLQYAPDTGEAFVRASELQYEGASVHDLDGPVASMQEVIATIESLAPDAAGLISAEQQPLPFPPDVDSRSFTDLVGGPAMRPLEEGIADALRRFERLLADGLVSPPEPSEVSAAR
jgi:UDP-glucuronate 4-epimerase